LLDVVIDRDARHSAATAQISGAAMWSAAMDVGGWLRGLGLGKYEAAFLDNGIGEAVLPHLTVEDLKEIGVATVGDRRMLLAAIAALAAPTSSQPIEPQRSQALPTPEVSAERRPITVMFCDLVGSTGLAAKLDPEDWRNLVNAYLDEASAAVTALGGHVLKKLGDGLMALFGYPHAQENDAERAVRAALTIQRALAEINAKNRGKGAPELLARIGIESGPVVVEATGEVFGDAPNVAARVETAAEPGTVFITMNVQRQVAGLFVVEEQGAQELKGVAEPVLLFRIVRASGGRRRGGARALTPFVGREEELGLIARRWERARTGEGQLTLIVGEPGLGKSRLIEEFHTSLAETPHTWVEWSASQLLQNTPLHPIAEWGRQRFGLDAPAEQRLADLEDTLCLIGLDPAEYAPLLAPLVDIPLPPGRAANFPPEELRRRQLAAMTTWVMAGARSQPVVLAFEDLHWADPTSLDLLRPLADRGAHAPLLLLATTRPEFRPTWSVRSHHSVISLSPLDHAGVARMVGEIFARRALSAGLIEGVSERTGGVPLFVEEVTRLLLERGEQGDVQAIPPTLQQSLAARLDRLGSAREVAQIGAVLGRDFAYALLRDVAELDEPVLQASLDRLADADLLFVEGAPPQASYRFKHALIQDAAYESLLKSRRQRLHARVAWALEELFPDVGEAQPDILARHCTEAGLIEKAIVYLHRAAQYSIARWAMAEAITQLQRGLNLLDKLPDNLERRRLELDLQAAIGVPLMAVRGMGVPEVEKAYARARQLCQDVGEAPQLFSVIFGLWWFYELRADLSSALELANQLLELARRGNEAAQLMQAHRALACTYFWLGEFTSAQPHFEQAMAHYDSAEHGSLALKYGQEPGVLSQGFASHNLWFLGFPDRALATMNAALSLASEVAHPLTLAFALDHLTWLHQYRREAAETRKGAETDMRFSSEQGLLFFNAHGTILHGWALAGEGDGAAGIASMRQGLAVQASTGVLLSRPYWLYLLSEVRAHSGDAEGGLRLLDEALTVLRDQHLWDAEFHRLRGELLLLTGAPTPHEACDRVSRAEMCFCQALEIARSQQSKSLELRAGSSLARLWAQNGKRVEARDLLAAIYGWFTEGFGTPDLRDAKALLETLQ
jgi:class 3 adenylate cyclase/tetratricopeptide (TPR) repeat protein